MYFIDSHIHLQDFNKDFALKVLDDEKALKLVVVSAKEEDFDKVAELMDKYKDKVVGAFGIHPWYAKNDFKYAKLEELLIKYPNALVGEIGFDGIKQKADFRQQMAFETQLCLAKRYNRPVILHGAKAFVALKKYENELRELKYVYHGFTRNREIIKFINKTNGYFGLGKMFLRQKEAKNLIREMPFDRILFETDAPFQIVGKNYLNQRESCLENLVNLVDDFEGNFGEQLIHNALEFIKC